MKFKLKTLLSCFIVFSFIVYNSLNISADYVNMSNGVAYRYTDEGTRIGTFSGFLKNKNGKMYYKNGVIVKNKWITANNGVKYYAGKNGILCTGWKKSKTESYYYFDVNGVWDREKYSVLKKSIAINEKLFDNVIINVRLIDVINKSGAPFLQRSSNITTEQAQNYIYRGTEYKLKLPKAIAEQISRGDKLVIMPYVDSDENNNYYFSVIDQNYSVNDNIYHPGIPYPVDSDKGSLCLDKSPTSQENLNSFRDRFKLFNRILLIRGNKLKLDQMYSIIGVDDTLPEGIEWKYTKGVDLFSNGDGLYYNTVNGENNYYGLFGSFNEYDDNSNNYVYCDGISEITLRNMMREIISEYEKNYNDSKVWIENTRKIWLEVEVI